jgi:DNA-directed RNA polymerase alpha subunit
MNVRSLKVTDLDLSVPCLKTLKLNNIEYLDDLTQYSLLDLANFEGMSRMSVNKIIKLLKDNNISLRTEQL